jgi:hypothetical protein
MDEMATFVKDLNKFILKLDNTIFCFFPIIFLDYFYTQIC